MTKVDIMETEAEVVSIPGYQRMASLGDFVPHTLVYLGRRPRSRLWAVGYLRNESDHLDRIFGHQAHPRESFALAWRLLLQGFSAMLSQAKASLRTRLRSMGTRRHRLAQQVDSELPCESPNLISRDRFLSPKFNFCRHNTKVTNYGKPACIKACGRHTV